MTKDVWKYKKKSGGFYSALIHICNILLAD